MKRTITLSFAALFAVCIPLLSVGQTTGILSLTFTQTPHTSYTQNKNVMAIWIQTSTGMFVKTRNRNVGGGTNDHLPTWAVNSGGNASNATSGACNTVGATTGATFTSFTTRTTAWDGTDVNGNVVADGTYKITIESTWNHGGSATTTRSFTFTKGPNADIQTPADDGNFTAISLSWTPSASEIEETAALFNLNIYPNPSKDGIFSVDYSAANSIEVLDILGNSIQSLKLEEEIGTAIVDLSGYSNGMYFLRISNGMNTTERKLMLGK